MTLNDEIYMRRALELAERGCGRVSPNPMVGAVLVKDGRIFGKGWHERYGEAHAERNALAACTESPEGAVLYVTLEPCCRILLTKKADGQNTGGGRGIPLSRRSRTAEAQHHHPAGRRFSDRKRGG